MLFFQYAVFILMRRALLAWAPEYAVSVPSSTLLRKCLESGLVTFLESESPCNQRIFLWKSLFAWKFSFELPFASLSKTHLRGDYHRSKTYYSQNKIPYPWNTEEITSRCVHIIWPVTLVIPWSLYHRFLVLVLLLSLQKRLYIWI